MRGQDKVGEGSWGKRREGREGSLGDGRAVEDRVGDRVW